MDKVKEKEVSTTKYYYVKKEVMYCTVKRRLSSAKREMLESHKTKN